MKRWLQWQFVVPRVLSLAVLLLGLQYALGVVARSMAIRSAQSTLGARVDVGHARVSIKNRQVVFHDVRLGSFERPGESILEADECELTFAAKALLHKRPVVENGRISGVRFNVATHDSPNNGESANTWFNDDAERAVRKYLSQLGGQFSLDSVKRFESVARTEAFTASWAKQSDALDARLKELDERAAELQKVVEASQANPLRAEKLSADLPKKVADLQRDFANFRTEMERLPDQLENERRAIVAARRRDGESGAKRLAMDAADAKMLSEYLLRDQAGRQLDELVGWLKWAREVAPKQARPQAAVVRGEDVLFDGCRRETNWLVRKLQLDGSARIAGQPVELRGTLVNLASDPCLHDLPMRLHLVGSGAAPFELQATIDRTTATPHDELLVDCQGLLLPAAALGRSDELKLNVAPSIGSLSVSLTLEGDKLTGDVQIVQQRVQMSPKLQCAGTASLASGMEETLSRVNSVATRMSLGGTLDKPTCALWSNVGTAVAEAMKRSMERAGEQHAKTLLAEAGRRVDERLAEIDRQVAEKQSRLASKTPEISARLAKIASQESPRYRISSEKGGRRLPNNSLFR